MNIKKEEDYEESYLDNPDFCKDMALANFSYFNDYYLGMEIPDHQKIWSDKIQNIKTNLLLLAPRDHGKTSQEDTIIFTSKGRKKIKDMQPGDEVISLNEKTLKIKHTKVLNKIGPYKKSLYKVKTWTGKEIEVSIEHPFFSQYGWQKLEELKIGDRIAVPRFLPHNQLYNTDLNWAVILGLLISEGGFKGRTFGNKDINLINDYIESCKKCGIGHSRVRKKNKFYSLNFRKDFYNKYPTLKGCNSYSVHIPESIFNESKEFIAKFLSYLYEGDGGTEHNEQISYNTFSGKLAIQIQELLLYFGIISLVKKSKKYNKTFKKTFINYNLKINDINIFKFAECIGFVSERKKKRLNNTIRNLKSVKRSIKLDAIPIDFIRDKIKHDFGNNICYGRKRAYNKAKELKLYLNNYQTGKQRGFTSIIWKHNSQYEDLFDKLEVMSQSDILWDKIIEIEEVGEKTCYDLHIEGHDTHNYIANNIFIHNSIIASFALPIWLICRDKNVRILIISKTIGQARKFLMQIEQELERNKKLIEDFGPFKDKWTATWLFVPREKKEGGITEKDPTIEVCGQQGGITGGHFDWIISDDLQDDENTRTTERMQNLEDWFFGTIRHLAEPWTKFLTVGTRKHYLDLYNTLLENPVWNSHIDKAIIKFPDHYEYVTDEDGQIIDVDMEGTYEVLWASKWTIKHLLIERRETGSILFDREKQNDPSGMRGQILKLEWLNFYTNRLEKIDLPHPPTEFKYTFFGIDLAVSEKETADYFVLAVVGVCKNGYWWILDIYRNRIAFPEQVAVIERYAEMYKPTRVYVESVAYQAVMVQHMQRFTNVPVLPKKTTKDKTTRMLGVSPFFESGKVKVRDDMDDFIKEWIQFPKAAHDDILDAVEIALTEIRNPSYANHPSKFQSPEKKLFDPQRNRLDINKTLKHFKRQGANGKIFEMR